jgi:hypothetical protein
MESKYYSYFPPEAGMDGPDGKRRKEEQDSAGPGDSREGFHEKAAAGAATIKLKTFKHFSLDKEAAGMSKILSTMFELHDEPDNGIEISRIDADVLEVVRKNTHDR